MDPHAFDQSLQKTSPKMNPAVRMMLLHQGTRSIEEYVADFLELAHLTQLDEICLMICFQGGLSEPLSSIMPLHEATWTLEEYSDLALKLSGSPFTVGVAEEENHPPHRKLHCQKLVTKWPPILSLITVLPVLSSCLPSQNLLSPGLPSRSPRPGWLPRLRMHLFGQD